MPVNVLQIMNHCCTELKTTKRKRTMVKTPARSLKENYSVFYISSHRTYCLPKGHGTPYNTQIEKLHIRIINNFKTHYFKYIPLNESLKIGCLSSVKHITSFRKNQYFLLRSGIKL